LFGYDVRHSQTHHIVQNCTIWASIVQRPVPSAGSETDMRTCWEIRRELEAMQPSGRNGWVATCAECAIYLSSQACWEQCAGSSCCCAPLSVTCDFCEIYIEHRREIAGLLQAEQTNPAVESRLELKKPFNNPSEGGQPPMEKIQFGVPNLWADHHTLKVREALSQLTGVQDVIASSAFRMVIVSYDPALVTPGALMSALDEAGYPVATDGTNVMTQPVPVQDGRRDPAWIRLGMRKVKTDERDLKTKR
jgi:copper chaperone CopZ